MSTSIRVLLVEDHRLVAEGIHALLAREPDLEVVGVASTAAEAVDLATSHHPAVVLMDFRLPDATGDQAALQMRSLQPRPKIVFVSGDESEEALLSAVYAGACGFLSKAKAAAEVVAAVRRAADGEMLIPPARLAGLLARARERERDSAERARLRARLTRREQDVLLLMANGLDNKSIATELGIGLTTVRGYVQDILEKLEAHSKLEAVAVAARHDLLTDEAERRSA